MKILPTGGFLKVSCFCAAFTICFSVFGQLSLVKDLNNRIDAAASGIDAKNLIDVNGILFFSGRSANGIELFKYENGEVSMVKDIHPGANSSNPHHMANLNGLLYFIASDGLSETAVWKSDGTTAGTVRVSDIPTSSYHHPGGGDPGYFVFPAQDLVYIFIRETDTYWDLWRTDGTEAGTIFLYDKLLNIDYPKDHVCVLGNSLLFMAEEASSGLELWASDGTVVGTTLLKDIAPGTDNSFPSDLEASGSHVYFHASSPDLGTELWKSDGTVSGTMKVLDLTSGSGSTLFHDIKPVGTTVLLSGISDGQSGTWKIDMATDVATFISTSMPGKYSISIAETFYSFEYNNESSTYELTKWDEANGASVVNVLSSSVWHTVLDFTAANGILYFVAENIENSIPCGMEVWRSDGTEAGTFPVTDFGYVQTWGSTAPTDLTASGSTLFFRAAEECTGNELWKIDSPAGQPERVTDLPAATFGYVNHINVFNHKFYFAAEDETYGWEPHQSDGTAEGTDLWVDTDPIPDSYLSNPQSFAIVNDKLLVFSNGLWAGDEQSVSTVSAAANLTNGYFLNASGNSLYVVAEENNNLTWKLWRTDYPFTSIASVLSDGVTDPQHVTLVDWQVYYAASETRMGLYLYDGTTSRRLKEFDWLTKITQVGNEVFFFGDDGEHTGLWKSDGTEAGTVLVRDLWESNKFYMFPMVAIGSLLYFPHDDGVNGLELWRSDGSEAGTFQVKDINSGSKGSSIDVMYDYKGMLYFSADDGIDGKELWVSDGTESGTVLLANINAGAYGSSPYNFYAFNNALYFTAYDNTVRSLWKTNGLPCGTIKVTSNTSVNCGGQFHDMAGDGSTILIPASTPTIGMELFKHDVTTDPPIPSACKIDQEILGYVNNQIYNTLPLELDITSSAGLPVTFASATPEIVSVNGNQVTMLKSGIAAIEATQPGDWGHNPVTSTLLFHISKADPRTTLDDIPSKVFGAPDFSLAAANDASLPIHFESSDPDIASVTGSTVTLKKAGVVRITASTSEDDRYTATSVSKQLTIAKADQSITFEALANKTYEDAPFELTASASSGLAVTFSSSDPLVASVSGSVVSIHKAGEVAITANQPGNENFNVASSQAQNLVIEKKLQSIAFVQPTSKKYGDAPFLLEATSSAGLTVSFSSSDPSLLSLSGTTATILKPGVVTLTASHPGNDFYTLATSTQSLTIEKKSQSITFVSPGAKTYGDPAFALEAESDSGLGLVFSTSDPSILSISGSLATIHKPGNVTLTASQEGNDYYSSTTSTRLLTIQKKSQSITFVQLGSKTFGDPDFALVAESDSCLDLIFSSSNASIVSISGSTATIHKGGNVTIAAVQAGNDFYESAISIQSLTIEKKSQIINFTQPGSKTYGDLPFQLDAVSPDIANVSFSSSDPSIVSIAGSTATIHKPGMVTLTAYHPGNDSFESASSTRTVTVKKAEQEITFTSGSDVLLGSVFTLNASSTSGLPVVFTSQSDKIEINSNHGTAKKPGRVSVSAAQQGSEYFFPALTQSQTFCIKPIKPTISENANEFKRALVSDFDGITEWYYEGVLIPNEYGRELVIDNDGHYSCRSVAEGCFSEMSDPISMVVTAVEVKAPSLISVYPNPATQTVTLEFMTTASRTIQLTDQLGKVHRTINTEAPVLVLDVESLHSGIYLVFIRDGSATHVVRIHKM